MSRSNTATTLPMRRGKRRSALLVSLIALSALLPAAASAERGGWSCNAYGVGGKRNSQWQTVSGEASGSKSAAMQSALAACNERGLTSCRPSGCWPG